MFTEIARTLKENIDEITRRWVDELRLSERTQVHNQLLTAEIVNGTKAMLANLAEAIEGREAPDRETVPIASVSRSAENQVASQSGTSTSTTAPITTTQNLIAAKARAYSTRPLSGPLARAQQAAAAHGKLRHTQDYQLHEVILEYIKLRQVIWSTMQASNQENATDVNLDMIAYVDRLFDELMLISLENFYDTSVRDLEKRAVRDPLTQLYNKDFFHQRLNEELRRAVRYAEPVTVAIIDMDLLKQINDTYGHPVGDAVIAAVGAAIKDTSRQNDIPCRYGGDEFAVILPETPKDQSHAFAERLVRAVQNVTVVVAPNDPGSAKGEKGTPEDEPREEGETRMPLMAPVPTLSIGLASFPDDARNPETLLAKADEAMYRAKKEGRNRISF